jgi:hypothetical protein
LEKVSTLDEKVIGQTLYYKTDILDRCYDFKNIFAFLQEIGVFDSKQRQIMENFDHNIGF